jgi:hypothetical protein
MNHIKNPEVYWMIKASNVMLNRTIVGVRYLLPEEAGNLGWHRRSVVIELDNGTLVYPSMDDEGNGAGALFTTDKNTHVLPVI